MKPVKITFYPKGEAAKALHSSHAKKISERVNELILKGLAKEKDEAIQREYEQYDRELAGSLPRKRDARGVSTTMRASERLFTDDEGSSDEGLI